MRISHRHNYQDSAGADNFIKQGVSAGTNEGN